MPLFTPIRDRGPELWRVGPRSNSASDDRALPGITLADDEAHNFCCMCSGGLRLELACAEQRFRRRCVFTFDRDAGCDNAGLECGGWATGKIRARVCAGSVAACRRANLDRRGRKGHGLGHRIAARKRPHRGAHHGNEEDRADQERGRRQIARRRVHAGNGVWRRCTAAIGAEAAVSGTDALDQSAWTMRDRRITTACWIVPRFPRTGTAQSTCAAWARPTAGAS